MTTGILLPVRVIGIMAVGTAEETMGMDMAAVMMTMIVAGAMDMTVIETIMTGITITGGIINNRLRINNPSKYIAVFYSPYKGSIATRITADAKCID
jgi:hypothetical protein